MRRIDQAIRESLLESFFYREACGQEIIPDRDTLSRKSMRKKSIRSWFQYGTLTETGFHWQENDPGYLIEPHKELYLIFLESYFKALQMQEIQKMRAE